MKLLKKVVATSLLILAVCHTTDSIANQSDMLPASVAKIMNTATEKIKLEKRRKGKDPAGTYTFELDNAKYTVKVFGKRAKLENRKKEIDIAETLSEEGVGAKFIGKAEDNSLYIREFIDGRVAKYEDFQNDEIIKKFAVALKKLHACKIDATSSSQLNLTERHFKKIMRREGIARPKGLEVLYDIWKKQHASLPSKTAFCHNNLVPSNILISKTGEIYFINSEYCGKENVYDELGHVTLITGISEEKLKNFLKDYLGEAPSEEILKTVKTAQQLANFAVSMHYFASSNSGKKDPEGIKKQNEELDNMLNSDALKSAPDLLKENGFIKVKSRKKDLIKEYALAFYKAYKESQ
ncbi:MAG: phosphotransferase [Holosporales bacterium]|jgi:thiamine kinase-like enzyme|nr:phosphotransferase [Holosporales bacterium]